MENGPGTLALGISAVQSYLLRMADTASPSNDPRDTFRALEADFAITPEHDTWMQAEIRKTLKAKADSQMTYRSLEDVARRFTPDAH